ncbi:MAG TPA: aminotransferase class IV, partial [Gammaproteobacteria bacterium]|nr:aminotransferase class IV [Gammaproteobacteria bacterium]
ILLNNGYVREGAATTVFIVQDNTLITPPLGPEVLPGITRSVILQLAADNNVPVREEKPMVDMLFTADEIWLASSTRELTAVTQLDGKPVGNGKPGPLWRAMYDWFQALK